MYNIKKIEMRDNISSKKRDDRRDDIRDGEKAGGRTGEADVRSNEATRNVSSKSRGK